MPDNEIVNLMEQVFHARREVWEAAVEGLRAFDREAFLTTVRDLLQTDDLRLWKKAAYAVAKIQPETATGLLLPYLSDSDPEKRYHIAGLLGDYGTLEAVELLMQILKNDPDADVRHLTAHSLGKLGDKRAVALLQWVKENDKGEDYEGRPIAEMAGKAIERIMRGT